MKSISNSLEQFIRQNRPAFDQFEPGPGAWQQVEKALGRLPASDPLEQFILFNRSQFDSASPSEQVWHSISAALNDAAPTAQDPLEAFIQNHREAFDSETPDLRVWAAIDPQLPRTATREVHINWRRNLLRIAAAVTLLVIGMSIGIRYARFQDDRAAGMSMSDVSSEYAELEQYYQRDISNKTEKLTSLVSYKDEDLNDDLSQMDNVMAELRQELANVPPGNREQVVRAMIDNYKAKAAILERVLEHLQQQQPATINSGNHEVKKI